MTYKSQIHFKTAKSGRKRMRDGTATLASIPPDRIPRISRLMALAIHFDGLIRRGVVQDYANLARLGGVSRARITQIMNLLNLPPWEQEQILLLDSGSGRARLTERELRSMVAKLKWEPSESELPPRLQTARESRIEDKSFHFAGNRPEYVE